MVDGRRADRGARLFCPLSPLRPLGCHSPVAALGRPFDRGGEEMAMLVRRLALPGRGPTTTRADRTDKPDRTTHIEVIEHQGLRWVDIARPTVREIEYLRREFGFNE